MIDEKFRPVRYDHETCSWVFDQKDVGAFLSERPTLNGEASEIFALEAMSHAEVFMQRGWQSASQYVSAQCEALQTGEALSCSEEVKSILRNRGLLAE